MTRQAALAPAESFYSSDGWLELLEGHGHEHRYLLLGEADRAVLAPVTDGEAVESGRYRPGFLLADRVEADRCLLAGPLSGYRNELRSGTGRPPAGEVAHGLLAAAAGRTVLLPYLPTVTAAGFEAAGYPGAVIAWDAWLDVPDAGFDEYLARLPRGHREQVKGDLRRIKRAGITFDAMPLQEPFRDLAELLVQHERKYDPGYRQPSERFAHYLARCAGLPGAHVILARRDGRVVGCHVVFHYTGVLWARLIGVDESSLDTRGCYFGLMFYETVKLGHRLGAGTVHLGIGTSEAKARRGAVLEPLWTVALTEDTEAGGLVQQGLLVRSRDLPDPLPPGAAPPPAVPSEALRPERSA